MIRVHRTPSLRSQALKFVLRRTKILRQDVSAYKRQRFLVELGARLLLLPARGVTVQSVWAGSAPAKWLIPAQALPQAAILYFHGGAFTYGSSNTHLALVSRLARAAGVRALSVDYRLAPEHTFPAALEDCLAAFGWLNGQGYPAHRIVVAGDSAGANLALALTMALRQKECPLPAGVACLSPISDLSQVDLLTPEVVERDPSLVYTNKYMVLSYVGHADPNHPLISPALGDLSGFPPLLIHVGGEELLTWDAQRLYERACQAGVQARLEVYPGMWHVFQAYTPLNPEAQPAIASIARFVQDVLAQQADSASQ